MTITNKASATSFLRGTSENTDTATVIGQSDLPTAARAALPRPKGVLPNVADSGRIKFGAGFRLPASK
jgi:hypothetical protein